MDIKDIQSQAAERIWLFPGEHDGEATLLWGDDPAPGQGMDPAEAVEYVRKDVHEAIIKRQANAAKTGMDAAKKHGSHMESEAKRLNLECGPEALESEREANAKLTELVAELERERDAYRTAEEHQIALRQKMEGERDALAAHVEWLREALEVIDRDLEGRNFLEKSSLRDTARKALAGAPTTSLARRDARMKAEALENLRKSLPRSAMSLSPIDLMLEANRLRRQTEAQQ